MVAVTPSICQKCEKDKQFFYKIFDRTKNLPRYDTPEYRALIKKARKRSRTAGAPIIRSEDGCCGSAIVEYLRKAGEIAEGFINVKLGKKHKLTDAQMEECLRCPNQTWLTPKEYVGWLWANKVKVLVNFRDLTVLPLLPKKDKTKEPGQDMYCMLCKCNLKAKTHKKGEQCPAGRWPGGDRVS